MVSVQLPKVYEARTKLQVTPGQASSGPIDYNDVLAAERLTRTYSEVATTRPVIEAAIRAGGLSLGYEQASKLLEVTPLRDTQLIQISVRANDPELPAKLANLVAAALLQRTQASQSSRFAASRDQLGRQVDQLAADIAEHTGQVDALRAQPPAAQRDSELARLQFQLTQLQQSHAAAARSYEEVRLAEARSSDLLTVIDPATPALAPSGPRVLVNVALGALVGFMIALGIALLAEHMDDRLTSIERLNRVDGLQALGWLALLPKDTPLTVDQIPAVTLASESNEAAGSMANHVVESFRLLRANLHFAALESPVRTLVATSADVGDGKTTAAANLAIVAAQAGQRVVLVDADLRRPSLHEVFGVHNGFGLTSLLMDEDLSVASVLIQTRVEGLWLLPSGPSPPSPSKLLASAQMRGRLAELRERADLVILDSPPVLAVSDPAVLAGLTDGTLLVVNAQRTRGQQAARAVAMLRDAGAHILGGVLNRVADRATLHYGYYPQRPHDRGRLPRLKLRKGHGGADSPTGPPQPSLMSSIVGVFRVARHGVRLGSMPNAAETFRKLPKVLHADTRLVAWELVVVLLGLLIFLVIRWVVAWEMVPPLAIQELLTWEEVSRLGARVTTRFGDRTLDRDPAASAVATVSAPTAQMEPPATVAPDGSDPEATITLSGLPTVTNGVAVSAPLQLSPGPVTSFATVFYERFADNQRGWPNNPQSTAWFVEGGYRLFARQATRFVAIAPITEPLRDVVVSGAFRKVGGPPGGGYGLIVRDQGLGSRDGLDQGGRYYVLEAGDRGEVGVWRREGDRWVDLLPWTRSDAVRPGGTANELTVRAIGPRLTLLVNGTEVAGLSDTVLHEGGVGIFVGGDLNEVLLEQFLVQVPS